MQLCNYFDFPQQIDSRIRIEIIAIKMYVLYVFPL